MLGAASSSRGVRRWHSPADKLLLRVIHIIKRTDTNHLLHQHARFEWRRAPHMVKLTLIARVSDGLPLAEGLDSDKDHELGSFKRQAKVRAAVARTRIADEPVGKLALPATRWLAHRPT